MLFLTVAMTFAATAYMVRQFRKPSGPAGNLVVRLMNQSHSGLTDWGLQHASIAEDDTVLDVGCGGGMTIRKLAAMAARGKVYGIDYSGASIAASRRLNRAEIAAGRVDVRKASVSDLPLPDNGIDLVTAVETHYYWPDRPAAMREILRVLKPGGQFLIIAEMYRDGSRDGQNMAAMKLVGGTCLSAQEHQDLFTKAGFVDTQIATHPKHGWLCALGRKPA